MSGAPGNVIAAERSALSAQVRPNPVFHFLGITKLTLPENQSSPTEELQRANVFPVSLDIVREFRCPIGFPASRHPALATPLMLVPKAAMHKDDFLPAAKH